MFILLDRTKQKHVVYYPGLIPSNQYKLCLFPTREVAEQVKEDIEKRDLYEQLTLVECIPVNSLEEWKKL